MFERLTRIDAGGIITGAKRGKGEYVGTQEMLERLYEYENSGLSPEEVQELAKAKAEGRLVELPTCNVTKLPCAGCNPCCEHRGDNSPGGRRMEGLL